jgi:hypothetical protein
MNLDKQAIEDFLHGQVDCWNRGDREGFFAHYRRVAPDGLSIEYVGQPILGSWALLEGMWTQQQPRVRVQVRQCIVSGNEAACHHLNAYREQEGGVETIELYRFEAGTLSIRYFIGQ